MYLCYRKKWLPFGLCSNRRPKSLPVSALHQDLHRLPRHVWQRRKLMLLFRASVIVTWRWLDVSLLACLVWVLLLPIVRLICHPRPFPSQMASLSSSITKLQGCSNRTTSTSNHASRLSIWASNCLLCPPHHHLCHFSRGSLTMSTPMMMLLARLI